MMNAIFTFLILALACAIISHAMIKRAVLAIPAASLVTTVVFHVWFQDLSGQSILYKTAIYLSTFFLAFLVGLVSAVPFRIWRREQNNEQGR